MIPKVYLETSVVSYLAARPSRDVVAAAHQAITGEWWQSRRVLFDLYCSELVVREARAGDPGASARRLEYLHGIPLLDVTPAALDLAQVILDKSPIPKTSAEDALHISVAAVHGMHYLLTWNCGHIANAEIIPFVRAAAEGEGYELPEICTPEELMGDEPDEEGSNR